MNGRRGAFHLLFAAIMLLVAAISVLAIDYMLWWVYVSHLEDRQKPKTDALESIPDVSSQTLKRLGRIRADRKSSFVNFDRRKAPGIIRIGAFGDSFTYGDEVDDENDYPAQMQKLFREYGIANVEILNFGSSWYSFGQAHIMWNEVGQQFDLDYVLLGPQTFHPDRETRFNHSEGASPYYIHSRYVLDGDGIRRIDVSGDSYSERFRNYYSFIPDSRVLRYDRNDPAFLAGALPEGRRIGNPFYYDGRSENDEAVEIQRRLFRDMRSAGKPVLAAVYSGDTPVREATKDLINGSFCIAELDRPMDFPYIAPWGHNAPTGNALLARQYMAAFLKRQLDARILHMEDLDKGTSIPGVEGKLSSFGEIHIKLDGIEAGVFSPTFPLNSDQKSPSFLHDDRIESLIALKSPENSILDGIFLAIPSDIPTTAPVRVVVQSAKGTLSADLRKLRPLAQGINLAQSDLPGLEIRGTYYGDQRVIINADDLAQTVGDISSDAKLAIIVGDKVVLEGSGRGEPGIFVLYPVDAQILLPRGAASADLAAERGSEEGIVDLELKRGAERYSIPIAQWWTEHRRLDPPAECSALSPLPVSSIAIDKLKSTAAGKPEKIVVTVSGDQFDGPPQMRVYLSGKLVGDTLVSATRKAGEWQSFTFTADLPERGGILEVELANDKYDAATERDRNLYIKDVSIGSQNLRPEEGRTRDGLSGVAGQPRPIHSGSLVFLVRPKN